MKKLLILMICVSAMASMQAQKMGNTAARKLQMAEFAIANLYVDSVDENKLVKKRLYACWHNSTRTPHTTMPRK